MSIQHVAPQLQQIIEAIPMMIQVHEIGSVMAVCTAEEVVYVAILVAEHTVKEDFTKHKLEPNHGFSHVMKARKRISTDMPDDYGGSARFMGIPIENERKQIIGAYGYSKPIKTQVELQETSHIVVDSSSNIAASTQQMKVSSEQFTSRMAHLAEAQKRMFTYTDNTKNMLQMINNIAKSTRILGLNAGVEAARSGSASKGFSVVASEITNLANQSANSVSEINRVMEDLTKQVEAVSKIVDETFEISEEQGQAITKIAESLDQLMVVSEKVNTLSKSL